VEGRLDILPFLSLVAKEPDMEILRVVFFASLFVGQFAVPGWAVAADKGYCSCLGFGVKLTQGYQMCRGCKDEETERGDCSAPCNLSEKNCSPPDPSGDRSCQWQRECPTPSSSCKTPPRGYKFLTPCPRYSTDEQSCKQTRREAQCVFIKVKDGRVVGTKQDQCF